VNRGVGTDGSKVVTVEVTVLGVAFALAGLTAKPSTRAALANPASMVLEILFTMFLENLLQQGVVALSNFSRFKIWGEQNVRVAHRNIATRQQKGWLSIESQPFCIS
jgi:hypothetical protein